MLDVNEVVEEMRFRVTERTKSPHGGTDEAEAFHIVRRPTHREIAQYRKKAASLKGTKIKETVWKAQRWLWGQIILKVEGYKGIPEKDWKKWFLTNDLGMSHVERVINGVVEQVTEDTDWVDEEK
ncbi:MAG TPA: hypothetical protein VLV83_21555 [Acidobacteriota bacterium]|nr:hypothetical protein [Acidobacteriota bacterium]